MKKERIPRILLMTREPAVTRMVGSSLGLQPKDLDKARTVSEAVNLIRRKGYPVVIADSTVLSGSEPDPVGFVKWVARRCRLVSILQPGTPGPLKSVLERESAGILRTREAARILEGTVRRVLSEKRGGGIRRSGEGRPAEKNGNRSRRGGAGPGEIELRFTRCNLPEVVGACLQRNRRRFLEKGVDLMSRIPSSCPSFRGDRDVILQVLDHLVGNALRFSRAGGRVEVSVAVQSERDGRGSPRDRKPSPGASPRRRGLIVTVRDTGVGIPRKEQKGLFLLSSKPTRECGRRSCDLPTSRFLVESHGGEIWVESGEAKGTAFHIFLPASV